jgi:hypothetical protein
MKTSELTGAALDWAVAKCEVGEEFIGEIDDPHFYSTDWAIGGAIIEREKIGVVTSDDDANVWVGSMFEPEWKFNRTGATPLIAAMRCYVASKLGDDVEIPASLNKGENMERSKLIQRLISDDIYDWGSTDSRDDYLGTILCDGFVGYNNQTTEELQAEWNERLACKRDSE